MLQKQPKAQRGHAARKRPLVSESCSQALGCMAGSGRRGHTCMSWSCWVGSKSSSRSRSSKPRVLLPVTCRSFSNLARISFLFRFFSCLSSSCCFAFSYGSRPEEREGMGFPHRLGGPSKPTTPTLTFLFRSRVSSLLSFLRSSLRRTEDVMLRG